jgi:SAM-dependent methyltransferase
MPPDLSHEQMPDLLRYWYLGPKPRRHMMLRRFAEVDARAAQLVGRGPARPRLLDIGSAWGFNVMAMDRLGFDVIGVDLVPDQFGVGQRIAEANGAAFPVAAADAARLPFRDGSFDAITMVETFEHIFLEDRPRALAECHRVLRPGGALVLSTPNYNSVVERFKRLTGRHPAVRRRLPTMCYPEEGTGRERYHPYRYHHPLPDGAIRSLLEAGGFEVEAVTHFLFMLKNTPGGIYPIARFLERLGESFAPLRRLSATSCFTARKS